MKEIENCDYSELLTREDLKNRMNFVGSDPAIHYLLAVRLRATTSDQRGGGPSPALQPRDTQ
jgi:hypothetical protein